MKLFYDSNGFIMRTVSLDTCVCTLRRAKCHLHHEDLEVIEIDNLEYPGLTCVNAESFNEKENVLDSYGLPVFKWVSSTVTRVNPEDYQIDPKYWEIYIRKITDEVINDIKTLSNDELKAIYNDSPGYKQNIIYQQIEFLSADTVPQVQMNLTFEVLLRCLAEYFHIKEVQQRELTTEETAAFHQVLTTVHDHSIGMAMPMSTTSWFQGYLSFMLSASDQLRTNTLSKRLYITGRL